MERNMYNYVWGNIFIYCQQHNINFMDIYYQISQYINENHSSENNRIFSTMEAEINILSNNFQIPIAEIFKSTRRDNEIINCCKNIFIECDIEFNKDKLRWDTYSIIPVDSYRFLTVRINKIFNYQHLKFDYAIIAELPFQSVNPDIPYIELATYYYIGRTFYLYNSNIQRLEKVDAFIDYLISSRNTYDSEHNILDPVHYDIIDFTDIIIKSSLRKCTKNRHSTYITNGIFFIIDNYYNVAYKIIPLVYCSDCKVYYMYENDYIALSKYGKVLCRVYNNLDDVESFEHLNAESVFKICGYTVNSNDNISNEERHQLLHFLIERNMVTLTQTLDFLQWLINSRIGNPSMHNAIQKWKNDFSYLTEKYNSSKNIIVV